MPLVPISRPSCVSALSPSPRRPRTSWPCMPTATSAARILQRRSGPTFKLQLTYVAIDENLNGQAGRSAHPGRRYRGALATASAARARRTLRSPASRRRAATTSPSSSAPRSRRSRALDIKPMYSYVFVNGQTSGSARTGKGGVVTTTSISGATGAQTNSPFRAGRRRRRHRRCRWLGHGRARESSNRRCGRPLSHGAVAVRSEFLYQFGSRQAWLLGGGEAPYGISGTKKTADISAWLVDSARCFQFGPCSSRAW